MKSERPWLLQASVCMPSTAVIPYALKRWSAGSRSWIQRKQSRTAGFRLKNLKKAQLIIIDEIGYANRFFTFISDTYETSPLLFTTNKEIIDWAEMMGDPVLTTALLDRPDRLFSNSK